MVTSNRSLAGRARHGGAHVTGEGRFPARLSDRLLTLEYPTLSSAKPA